MSQDTIGSKKRLGSARMISCLFSLQSRWLLFWLRQIEPVLNQVQGCPTAMSRRGSLAGQQTPRSRALPGSLQAPNPPTLHQRFLTPLFSSDLYSVPQLQKQAVYKSPLQCADSCIGAQSALRTGVGASGPRTRTKGMSDQSTLRGAFFSVPQSPLKTARARQETKLEDVLNIYKCKAWTVICGQTSRLRSGHAHVPVKTLLRIEPCTPQLASTT